MQRVSHQLLRELRRQKHVRVYPILQRTSWQGIVMKTVVFWFRLVWVLPMVVRRRRPDVILFSSVVTASVAMLLRPWLQVPLVAVAHGKDVTMPILPFQWILPQVFASLDAVIAVSRATRLACIRRGISVSSCSTIANGFVPARQQTLMRRHAREALERAMGRPVGSEKILLTVGRLVKRKGHAWFIADVLPRLPEDTMYLIIGDGPELDRIRKTIEQARLGERVVVAGRQPDHILQAAYTLADLFVMPNIPVEGDMEGFGVAMLEANAHGLPVIASDLEGIRDVIKNGVNGQRVPHSSADHFVAAIEKTLRGAVFSGENVRRFVEAEFAWPVIASRYSRHLSTVIHRYQLARTTERSGGILEPGVSVG
jgi:phosphatidylinositol alpha-1,6-mannosyltransferase